MRESLENEFNHAAVIAIPSDGEDCPQTPSLRTARSDTKTVTGSEGSRARNGDRPSGGSSDSNETTEAHHNTENSRDSTGSLSTNERGAGRGRNGQPPASTVKNGIPRSNHRVHRDSDHEDGDGSGIMTNQWAHSGSTSPWPLLSSPKSPPSSKNGRHHLHNYRPPGGESMESTRTLLEKLRASPPAHGWPQRSPMKPEHEHDLGSFTLFTQSFDTLSETGQYLRASPVQQDRVFLPSPENVRKATHRHDMPPRRIELTHHRDNELGDISPIRLDDQRHHAPHRSSPSCSYRRPAQQSQPQASSNKQSHAHQHQHQRTYSSYPREASGPQRSPPPPNTRLIHRPDSATPTPVGLVPAPNHRREEPWGPRATPTAVPATPCEGSGGVPSSLASPSNPFFVLRAVHKAFHCLSYKLPCINYDRDPCPVNLSTHHASIHHFKDENHLPGSRELEIASRRVDTAVHAFGGYSKPEADRSRAVIFRGRKSASREHYDDLFHRRYFIAGNHISWDVEEHPPVATDPEPHPCSPGGDPSRANTSAPHLNGESGMSNGLREAAEDATDGGSPNSSRSSVLVDSQQKMKYRCKLCGQPKQNHVCPYRQSLQRSIGVMVYPVVNAFTASEPGILTKPLSEMNNFVSYDSGQPFHQDTGPDHDVDRTNQVTPETTSKTRLLQHSPESSLSMSSEAEPSPHRHGQKRTYAQIHARTPQNEAHKSTSGSTGSRRTGTSMGPQSRSTFVSRTLTLRPEHYRAVTSRKPKEESILLGSATEDYQYPHVPLTFQERKRLSDTLFFLSKEIPSTTAEVASLLRLARERDEWDLAVSEILTQVVVALYCGEGDHRLDGLKSYLLGIGVSC